MAFLSAITSKRLFEHNPNTFLPFISTLTSQSNVSIYVIISLCLKNFRCIFRCSCYIIPQYFDNVPEIAWNFYIGGYQPAQKWLKDRKERELNFDDILHYQKIIVALFQTDKLMNEIDKIVLNN